jgi:hypothetical protein
MSLKAAPRREVVDVVRKGDWGDVTYHHQLVCGHTEVRKRPAKAGQIACESCLLAKQYVPGTTPLAAAPSGGAPVDDMVDPLQAEIAYVEGRAGRMRAGLASFLRVPLDAVDVVVGDVDGRLQVLSAVVHLEPSEAERLIG